MNNLLNMFKENKNLKYAVNIFILLVIISLILKFDTSIITGTATEDAADKINKKEMTTDDYVSSLEERIEKILGKIENMQSVDVMIYTKKTPEMKPVYDENISNESNIETGTDGTRREVKRETRQQSVILGGSNQVVERLYEYPEISGVLIVAKYSGDKDIYTTLMNCVKTLLDININDIEVILSNK